MELADSHLLLHNNQTSRIYSGSWCLTVLKQDQGGNYMAETYYKAINWNEIEDVIDKSTWEKLTEQFWLDTRIPLSNDLDDWRKLSDLEKK